MTELLKMRYKDFEFPVNPSVVSALAESRQAVGVIIGESSSVSSVNRKPMVISGSGNFYGDSAVSLASELCDMLGDLKSGWLFAPSAPPIKAFFTSFKSTCNTEKNCVSYSFTFTEDCSGRKTFFDFGYTIAKEGENAFDIANRTGVSVDKIMEKNVFYSPFLVKAGSKVRLK